MPGHAAPLAAAIALLLPLAAMGGEPSGAEVATPATTAAAPPTAAPGASGPTARPVGPVEPLLAAVDAAWPRRDERGVLDEVARLLGEAERTAPAEYGVLWRLARLYFWRSDDPALPDEEKSELGKLGWQYGDRASAVNPAGVEGWDYAAAGMGNYALGIGVLTALAKGIEGKFKDRLSRAEAIDPGFEHGAIQTAWGRFWFKLPWPKYDGKRCEQALRAALGRNADNVRAWYYLGEYLRDEGRKAEARQAWTRAIEAPPGKYDPPEERRWQAVARAALAKLGT